MSFGCEDIGNGGLVAVVGALGLLGTLFAVERGKRKAAEVKADAETQRADAAKASAERTRETAAEVEAAHVEGAAKREESTNELKARVEEIEARPAPLPPDASRWDVLDATRREREGK